MFDAAAREKLRIDGFAISKGLFAAEEIAELNSIVAAHFRAGGVVYRYGLTQPHASVAVPALQSVFADLRVIAAFRELLGDELMWTGHADAHEGMGFAWHRDDGTTTPGGSYFESDHYVPECRVVKAGIYLQDHSESGGLAVRPGTHLEPSDHVGDGLYLPTHAGDVVFFDIRIQHRGQRYGVLERAALKAGRALGDDRGTTRPVAQLRARMRRRPPKRSIFFTFGVPNSLTDEFSATNMRRQEAQSGIRGPKVPVALRESFAANGVFVAPSLDEV